MSDNDFGPDPTGFFRAWATDAQGNKTLVGLTAEETELYIAYSKKIHQSRVDKSSFPWASVKEKREEQSRWLLLHDKHEKARIQVVVAEVELREKPTLN